MLKLGRKVHSSELFTLVLLLIFASNITVFSPFKLLLLVPIFLFVYLWRISIWWILFSLLLCCFLVALQHLIFLYGLRIRKTYPTLLNVWFPLNRWILDHLERVYPKHVADVIGSIVFNGRRNQAYESFSDFGVTHLIFISALHFSLLRHLIFKLTGSRFVVYGILILYWAAIDYSIPALKVLLFMCFRGKKRDDIRIWSLVALASLFFNPHMYSSVSFLLSHFFSLLFILNRKIFRSKLTLSMVNSLSAFVLSNLFFLNFYPKKIYPLAMVNAIIFTPIIMIIFIYFFCTWFISALLPAHSFVADVFTSLGNTFSPNAAFISVQGWNYDLTYIGLAIFGILWIILLGKCCGYTTRRIRAF